MTEVVNIHHGGPIALDPDYVYVGRNSPYGNPFTHLKTIYPGVVYVESRQAAVECYRLWILTDVEVPGWTKPTMDDIRRLRGKKLGCFCAPLACHGDVLAELADSDG